MTLGDKLNGTWAGTVAAGDAGVVRAPGVLCVYQPRPLVPSDPALLKHAWPSAQLFSLLMLFLYLVSVYFVAYKKTPL